MIKDLEKQINKEYESLLKKTGADEDKIDEFFEHMDFTGSGGITPFQFSSESFLESIKEKDMDKDDIIRLGMLYTLIYGDTDLNGENSTLNVIRECDECKNTEHLKYKDLDNDDVYDKEYKMMCGKCKKCGNDEYTIRKDFDF